MLQVSKTLHQVHEGPVFSLLALEDGHIVSGGGGDGKLLLWDSSCENSIEIAKVMLDCRLIH